MAEKTTVFSTRRRHRGVDWWFGVGDDLQKRRLTAQHLLDREHSSVVDVARSQLATQAQDFHGATWALALRSASTVSDVGIALENGSVVRTWPMRGTLMMTAADDARWLTELLAPRSFQASAGVWRQTGLDEQHFARAADIARDTLGGGRVASRTTLLAAFDTGGVDTSTGRGSHLLRRLAGECVIVFAAPRGTEQTFALLDEWAPGARQLTRESSLAELAIRYVAGHGPATVHDLAWWSGLTVADARRAVTLAGDAIAEAEIAGVTSLVAEDAHPTVVESPRVHLLPPFDELLLGYRDRTASLDPRHKDAVVPSSNGLFLATVTVDGRVVGTWRRTLTGSGDGGVAVNVTALPGESALVASEAVQRQLAHRSAEYAAFLGRRLA